jgi:LacI family transcriptional regulator
MTKTPHVAVLIESSRAFGRGLLEGVSKYIREQERWSIYFEPRGLDAPLPKWLADWKGDGILARINDRHMATIINNTGLPVVDLRNQFPEMGFCYVGPDNRAIVRVGYEHLKERGFRQFACCLLARESHPGLAYCCELLKQMAKADGFPCSMYNPNRGDGKIPGWEEEQAQFAQWILALPKPMGLLTFTDDCGFQVLDACRRAGVRVPDEVAVVGSGNDAVLCTLTNPPMSSIELGAAKIGYEATALLAQLMRSKKRNRKPVQVILPPVGVVTRHSSDVLAVDDPAVADAVSFIRENACRPIMVEDVLRHVGLSRTVLDLRFKAALGRTTKAEVLRVQLETARRLLFESNLSLDTVARQSGFSSAKYMGDAFARVLGIRPGEYRERYRD